MLLCPMIRERKKRSSNLLFKFKEKKWSYFAKIVAVPADATFVDIDMDNVPDNGELWLSADGKEIGPSIWGAFAIVEEISNDPCLGEHGTLYVSPAGPELGKY